MDPYASTSAIPVVSPAPRTIAENGSRGCSDKPVPKIASIMSASPAARIISGVAEATGSVIVTLIPRPRSEVTLPEVEAAIQRHELGVLGSTGPERLLRAITEERERAESDQRSLALLEPALGPDPRGRKPLRVDIPALPGDVHDLGTLAGVAKLIAP